MTTMFVNLPVADLERAKAFYTAIGFTSTRTAASGSARRT
jgi:predicted lactoylglutathione lyase